MLFCWNLAYFSKIQLECDLRTDGRTDTPSYRDARTHLKTGKEWLKKSYTIQIILRGAPSYEDVELYETDIGILTEKY